MALKSPNQKNGAHYLVSTNPRTPETERLLLLRTSRNSDSALPSCKTIKCPSGYRLGWLAAKRQKIDRHGNAGLGLCGIPLCFKANIATGIFPTSAATPALINHLPKIPSRVAERLFSAGALPGASGNMHELSFGITSNNYATGAVRNPWNPSLIPGGSSGGVAAAVASRLMLGGIGTDTGASVRLPAALCGVVGFRPTLARYPRDRIIPVSPTRDTAGIIAQCVADVIILDQVISGRSAKISPMPLKGLRIGLPLPTFTMTLMLMWPSQLKRRFAC